MKNKAKKELSHEEIMALLRSTTGHKKLVNYIKEIIVQEPFKKEVARIQKKLQTKKYDLMDDVVKLLAKYHLEFECFDFMMSYITDNEFNEELIGNMLFTEDIIDTKDRLKGVGSPEVERLFPVVIRVSPYASKRDILDYVEKLYRFSIEPIQKNNREKTTLGKVKSKKDNITKRNDFIYKNKDLPHQEIMSLVGKEFKEYLDVGHIGKIISLEKKKRKEP